MRWRIYYEDGSVLEGETEADAMAAPTKSAQMTTSEVPDSPRGRVSTHGADFHVWLGSFWSGRDRDGMIDYILHREGPQKILMGRAIYDKTYKAIRRKALWDNCFCKEDCNHVKEGD